QAVYTAGTNETSTELRGTPLAITAYSFSSPPATGTIDHTNKTIKVVVPNGTDRNALVANFTAPGAIVKVGTATQTSGSTSNNFTNPVTYTLTTNNDASTCSYVVTVNEKLATPSPSVVGSNITTSSIKIHWDTITGADRYGVDVSENNSFLPGSFQHKEVSANFCIMNGLKAGTKYYYRVQAIAEDQYFNSDYSSVYDTTTDALIPGAGSTEIDSSYETTINVGEYVYGQETVTPTVKVDPTEFSPSENDIITVTMSYGTTPEGLQYNLAFENPTIGNGTFILYYSGLSYDPTDVGYRLNGGALHSVGGGGINTTDKTVIFTMSGLGKGSKAAYELQIVLNDESGQTLPVVLTSFTATQMVDGKVRVDWVTQSETNLSGFRVLRNTVAEISTAMAVSPLIEATNTSATVVYSFMDSEVPGNGIYYYWLQIEDLDGGISYSAVYTVQVTTGGVTNPIIPKITALLNPFPNPFNPDVTIPFDLAVDGNVTLKIYNLKGQLIKNLLNENCKANSYRILWDGKDNEGHTVSTGTYIIRMNAPNYQASHKISLIK
ncbi:MAG TPA: FlgD immunoglobulin-like domain containing protein, partial [Candidatus Cloacimonas acidaminovorans]|nr:FlgD immunoglobulin-like domain containing protein [Candidatus Cloacimonas acidaminovorans]